MPETDVPALPLRFYFAARYSRREELVGHAGALQELGHVITSRWLDETHRAGTENRTRDVEDLRETEEVQQIAADLMSEDVEDLMNADIIVAFTEPRRSKPGSGGRHVEWGIALGVAFAVPQAGKRMILVGPAENVFYAVPGPKQYATFTEFLTEFTDLPRICDFTTVDRGPDGTLRMFGPCVLHPWHRGPHMGTDDLRRAAAGGGPNRQQRRSADPPSNGLMLPPGVG